MNDSDIVLRIKQLTKELDLSVTAFSYKISVPQQTLCKQMAGTAGVSLQTIKQILVTFPDLSAEWLLRGQGAMYTNAKQDVATTITYSQQTGSIQVMQQQIDELKETQKQLLILLSNLTTK